MRRILQSDTAVTAAASCQVCRFWDRYGDSQLGAHLGDCRRHPPRISETLLKQRMPGRGIALDEVELELTLYPPSAFPVTHEESWCGEHQTIGIEA